MYSDSTLQDYCTWLFGIGHHLKKRLSNHKQKLNACFLIASFGAVDVMAANPSFDQIISLVDDASNTRLVWDGPTTGPTAAPSKNVIYIAADLRNGGVNGVARGVAEAAKDIHWQLRFLDAKGSAHRQTGALNKAILAKPDGIILGGFDAHQHKELLQIANEMGIAIVGWHSTGAAGPDKSVGLFTNLTTDPNEVAKLAAYYAIASSDGEAKVVIFTDPNYAIAQSKADVMAEVINRCDKCSLLSIENLPLEDVANQMPRVINRLFDEYATSITNFLVINDLYIDFAVPSIEASGLPPESRPMSISAGDGSEAAYDRIQNNRNQVATVPEPLTLHGWQLIDELNRAFNNQPDSGFSASPSLVTSRNIHGHKNTDNEVLTTTPEYAIAFKSAYRNIWKGGKSQ